MKPPFERTSCPCEACKIGCWTKPGTLMPHDLEHFDEKDLLASEGGIYRNKITGEEIRIPSLVPKQRPSGDCVFFWNERCMVHEHSPFGCAYFDMHGPHTEVMQWGMEQLMLSMALQDRYFQTFQRLYKKGQIAKPLEERERAFEEAERKLWELIHAHQDPRASSRPSA